jgi:flavin reductase (DIM6/NTAB) family NADH-FMN oxidoreductase RutF
MVNEMKKVHWNDIDLLELDQRFRTTFINSISGCKSVCLVGTKSNSNLSNLAIFSSLVHIGANPPLLGLIFRPDSVERHTLENIYETNSFTINAVSASFVEAAHQTSARYARDVSEFDAVGLTEHYNANFFAPFVAESPVQLAMELQESIAIESNGTTLVIGKILHVFFPENALDTDGFLDTSKTAAVSCVGLDAYYSIQPIGRFPYAKPKQ